MRGGWGGWEISVLRLFLERCFLQPSPFVFFQEIHSRGGQVQIASGWHGSCIYNSTSREVLK